MSDPLENKLDSLVCENWGLLTTLTQRAKAISQDVVRRSRETFLESAFYKRTPELQSASVSAGSDNKWYLYLSAGGVESVFYAQVEILQESQFSAKVFAAATVTNLKKLGIDLESVRASLPEDVRRRFVEHLDTRKNSDVIGQEILRGTVDDVVEQLREAVERQVELAVVAKVAAENRKAASAPLT